MNLAALFRRARRWSLRNQLDQIDHQLTQLALQREQDRRDERLLLARRALLQSELTNT